jgi:glycosyltransferase involved in cell wall biosynthesis
MRVLMTADVVGGVFSYAVELCRALGARGVEIALATKGRPLAADQRAALRGLRGVEVHESAYRLEWMEDPWDDVARASEWLLGLAARARPDVVHLNDFAHGALPFGAPAVVVGHSCVPSWFEAVRRAPPPPSFDRYRAEVRRGLAAAALVVAPTRAMLSALERHHGPLRRSAVIPNGRDPRAFSPAPKEPLVLCAARLWDEAKNAAALDAAADGLPWPVYLAGERVEPGRAGAAAAGPRHARALGRLGPRELAGWYARAAIYALPARYEPFGLSPLEAALSGCALVLGDLPSLRETWEGAALFVPAEDVAALAAALRRLAASEELRGELARRARARALAFGPEQMARGYLEAYASARAEEARPCGS